MVGVKEINSIYNKIFKTYPQVEIKEHIKKLIEFDFFYPYNATFFCITNTANQSFEYVSKNFSACTGLSPEELKNGGMNYFWSLFHPNVVKPWLTCLESLMSFTMNELDDEQRKRMSYTWNYRIKNAKGKYISIIQNTTPLQFDKEQKPIIGLAHYTVLNGDINMDVCASAKYLNDKNEYETLFYKNISSDNLLQVISNRERDIIRLLLRSKTSLEISKTLNISKHTVDTHRRNILKKLNLNSTYELINYFKSNLSLI
ncbi:LuxR C-terminal-related transcriptional regulator [Polaribacter sp. MSW13]|uniref:LuxR C-terminal-related transcriptional regulator n=1 Tax=Polaribacter marinus TaxID=2916838 RepID=A0A9X1VPN8_9FLAO|nr:LuxR C-terminal-related transcriptional regulator [Polaribacter marinus]MCI2230117.1 LuxR C-terminal-related transcriptional regulator [Polaribacter marinus]